MTSTMYLSLIAYAIAFLVGIAIGLLIKQGTGEKGEK